MNESYAFKEITINTSHNIFNKQCDFSDHLDFMVVPVIENQMYA